MVFRNITNLAKLLLLRARDVHVVTASEKSETASVVACCNAERNFPHTAVSKAVMKLVFHLDQQ